MVWAQWIYKFLACPKIWLRGSRSFPDNPGDSQMTQQTQYLPKGSKNCPEDLNLPAESRGCEPPQFFYNPNPESVACENLFVTETTTFYQCPGERHKWQQEFSNVLCLKPLEMYPEMQKEIWNTQGHLKTDSFSQCGTSWK